MIVVICMLLLLPSVSLALVDAPAPWLRALCNGMSSCTDLFGGVSEFVLCEETDETCSFNVFLDQSNCHQLCRSLGSRCVDAVNNTDACNALPNSDDTCLTRRNDEICTCERRNDVVTNRIPCATAFGEAPGFLLCNEEEAQCTFAATTNGSNCNAMCGRFNARCIGALDNEGPNCTALPNSMDDCSTNRGTEICICERPFEQ